MIKPPYKALRMADVDATPKVGLSAISTFSGCGGSSLGYKLAGFNVLWASEFVPAAADVYRRNHPTTILDTSDIRSVSGVHILSAIGKKIGELDLLDGSPPCAAFSTAGSKDAGWGRVRKYSDVSQRVDDLFFEYIRLVDEVKPRVFVAENVSGLVKGSAKGYFKSILASMRAIGYRVQARLLEAQWLGVAQTRQRLIFIGVRNDIDVAPAFPSPLPYRYTIRDAIPWIDGKNVEDVDPSLLVVEPESSMERHSVGKLWHITKMGQSHPKRFQMYRSHPDMPSHTITATSTASLAGPAHPFECRRFSIAELKRLCGFPDDFVLTGSYEQQAERLGRAVPPPMMRAIAEVVRDRILLPTAHKRKAYAVA